MIQPTRHGSTVVLRLAHGKANALDTELVRALRQALDAAVRSDARSMVLTASGTIFSAGVDLFRLVEGGRRYLEEFLPELSACFRELFAFPKPAVAAVNGHAIAGGCVLACACDRRLMARGEGRIGLPELEVGVPFPSAALEIVRFAFPSHRMAEAVLLGKRYAPEQALEIGLLDELVDPDQLLERSVAAAEELAAAPSSSFRRIKRDLRRPVLEAWERLAAAHDRETLEAWASPEVQRAVGEYVERTLKR